MTWLWSANERLWRTHAARSVLLGSRAVKRRPRHSLPSSPDEMRSLVAAAAILVLAATPASAQVSIDFEGTGAPCAFAGSPVGTHYSGLGVTFSDFGELLNQ